MCLNILEHFQATLQRDFGEIRDRDQADVVEGEVGGEQLIVTDINMDFNAQLSPEVNRGNTGKTLFSGEWFLMWENIKQIKVNDGLTQSWVYNVHLASSQSVFCFGSLFLVISVEINLWKIPQPNNQTQNYEEKKTFQNFRFHEDFL